MTENKSWGSVILLFLLKTAERHYNIEDKARKHFRCHFDSSVLWAISTCATVLGCCCCCILHFQFSPHIIYWGQVRTADGSAQSLDPHPPHPCPCDECRLWFCIVLFWVAWLSLDIVCSPKQRVLLFYAPGTFASRHSVRQRLPKAISSLNGHSWRAAIWEIRDCRSPSQCPLSSETSPDSLNHLMMLCSAEEEYKRYSERAAALVYLPPLISITINKSSHTVKDLHV